MDMPKYGIVVGLEELPLRQPVNLRGSIEHVGEIAKKHGYGGLELHIKDPRRLDGAKLKAAADRLGLEFTGIATGMEYTVNRLSLIDDDPAVRDAAVKRLEEHIELGAEIGAPVIVGIMRANIPDFSRRDRYVGFYTDALRRLDARATERGVKLYIENINRYICNHLCTVPETADFIRRLGCPSVSLHIDTHSMNIEDVDFPATIAGCADILGYVHYSDSNRLYPGGGNMDFQAIHSALARAGYQGWITMECLPLPDQEASARLGMEHARTLRWE